MLEQMLESFLGTDHGRNAQQTLQQQGVPQSRIQQILSEALAAHSNGATPQASSGLLGSVFPFVSRFVQEHLGGSPQQNGTQQANNPAAQAKFDANVAGKGMRVKPKYCIWLYSHKQTLHCLWIHGVLE